MEGSDYCASLFPRYESMGLGRDHKYVTETEIERIITTCQEQVAQPRVALHENCVGSASILFDLRMVVGAFSLKNVLLQRMKQRKGQCTK